MDESQQHLTHDALCLAWREKRNAGYLESSEAYEFVVELASSSVVDAPSYSDFMEHLEKLKGWDMIDHEPFHNRDLRITHVAPDLCD